MKKMILMSLGLAMGTAFGAASNRPASDGPYKDYYFVRTDRSSRGSNSYYQWTKDNSNESPAVSGRSYYLGPDATYYIYNTTFYGTSSYTFPGDDLAVAGTIEFQGSAETGKDWTIPTMTLLSGSVFRWKENIGPFLTGTWTVKGTTESPATIQTPMKADVNTISFQPLFAGDETACLRFVRPSGSYVGQTFTLPTNYPDYAGTIEFGGGNVFSCSTLTFPGTAVVTNGATLKLDAASGTSSFDSLIVRPGATLELISAKNTHLIKIEDRLVLDPGSILVHNKDMGGTNTGARTSWPLFDLSAEAYAAGLPDFSKVIMTGVYQEQDRTLPRTRIFVSDGENGRKIVTITTREIVRQVKQCHTFTPNPFSAGDSGQFWSNGTTPTAPDDAEKDFYAPGYYSSIAHSSGIDAPPYVFPGASFRHQGAIINVFTTNVTFKTLFVGGGSQWTMSYYPDRVYDFNCDEFNVFEGQTIWEVSGRDHLRLTGPIVGEKTDSSVLLRMISPVGLSESAWSKSWVSGYFNGTVELTGDNSDFAGTFYVRSLQATSAAVTNYFTAWGMAPFVPGPSSNMTLRVTDKKNLGGTPASFAYNKVTVENQCRLELAETAAFDDPNRGWYFPGVGYIRVPDGKTATVSTPISFVAATRLVKEGSGTLALAGTPNIRTTGGTFTIQEGGVQIASADAFKGLPVTVGKNGKLVFDAASPVTLDLTTANTSLAGENGAINVEILDPNTSKSEAAEKLTLFTVPTEQSAALVAALKVRATLKDGTRRCRIAAESSGDTTSSIVADYSQQGMMIIFR